MSFFSLVLYICVGDVVDVVFYVGMVRHGAVDAHVWGLFRHALYVSPVYLILLRWVLLLFVMACVRVLRCCESMCVLHVSFWSKVRPRTFGSVGMGSAVLFMLRSRLLLYSAGSGVNNHCSTRYEQSF